MKFIDGRPDDGDVVEVLLPSGEWVKFTYCWGAVGLGYIEEKDRPDLPDRAFFLDDHPDIEWRHIKGHDMLAIGKLPPKNEVNAVTLRVHSSTPADLDEFISQFGATMSSSDFDDGIFLIEAVQESAPYLAQQITQKGLGWDIEEVKNG